MGGYNVDKNAGLIIGDGDFSVIGGTLDITENGVYDVTTYKNVDVDYNVKNEDVTVTPELYEQEITPSAGYDGLGVVRVESRPLNLQSKQVAPSELTTFVTADEGYDGLSSVTVDNVNAEQLGFEKEYYAEGHTFMGLDGTYNPFPEHSYGGIYITEVDEYGYPVKFLIKDYEKALDTFPVFFDKNGLAATAIKEIFFENCPSIVNFATGFFKDLSNLRTIKFPQNIQMIPNTCFQNCGHYSALVIPETVDTIYTSSTFDGIRTEEVILPQIATQVEGSMQYFVSGDIIKKINIPHGFTSLKAQTFVNIGNLETLYLPNTLTYIHPSWIDGAGGRNLTNVTLENGFNCSVYGLNRSTLYSVETIVSWLEALADRTGQTTYTLTMGTTNLNKLTAEQKAIAINKNWNLN